MEREYRTRAGIPVYAYPNAALHGFCLSLYVRAGSMYETAQNNGVTHCLEHMVFRNIHRAMNGGLYPLLDRNGLTFNAETNREFVQFFIVGATEHFADAVSVMARIFDPISLPAEDLLAERSRVRSEIRESDERTSLDAFADGIVWKDTSLALPITGKSRTLSKMSCRFLNEAAKEIFTKNQTFFYVTGNVSETQLQAMCDAVSAPLPEGAIRDNTAPVPANFRRRPPEIFLKNSADTVVRWSFDFDPSACTNAQITLLYDILFYGECGKVYRELSDRTGLVYSFDPSLERYRNAGAIHLKYEVRPGDLLRSVELLVGVFNGLKQGITDELDYVRPLYADNSGLLLDNAEDFNWTRAYETKILGYSYPAFSDRCREFAAVTPEEISALAQRIFRRSRLTFALKGDRRKTDLRRLETVLEKLD